MSPPATTPSDKSSPSMSRRWVSWSVDVLLVVAVAGVVFYVARQNVPAGTLRLAKADWRALTTDGLEVGAPDGKVSIVEFMDYQCPVCARVEPLLANLEKQYPNQIRRVVRHLPIESLHPQAMGAAKAVECARTQSVTREMHDLLFSLQPAMKEVAFDTLARAVGAADPVAFATCHRGDHPRIRQDVDLAESLGISGTPTIIVDGLMLTSFSPALLLQMVKARLD